MLKYIPNTLTIIRFLLIPFILFYIFTGNYILAFVIFTISALTDIADGVIARKFNLISNFGKLMDPLADKSTQIAVLTSLVITDIIPIWILLIVLLKEFIMIVGASFLYGKDVVVYSRWYGKLATVLFYLAIVLSLILKQFNLLFFTKHIPLLLAYMFFDELVINVSGSIGTVLSTFNFNSSIALCTSVDDSLLDVFEYDTFAADITVAAYTVVPDINIPVIIPRIYFLLFIILSFNFFNLITYHLRYFI